MTANRTIKGWLAENADNYREGKIYVQYYSAQSNAYYSDHTFPSWEDFESNLRIHRDIASKMWIVKVMNKETKEVYEEFRP